MKSGLIERFLDGRTRAASTRETHQSVLTAYLAFLREAAKSAAVKSTGRIIADKLIKDATPETIIAFKNELLESHNISEVVKRINILRIFYNYLAEETLIENNPFPVRPEGQKTQWIYATRTDIGRMAEAQDKSFAGVRNRAVIWLMYSCGLTINELVAVKFSDIFSDKQGSALKIGSGLRIRNVPIIQDAATEVYEYIRLYSHKYRGSNPGVSAASAELYIPPKALFVDESSNAGLIGDDIRLILNGSCLLADILYAITSTHIRHGFAKRLIDKGTKPEKLQYLLGHTQGTYTKRWVECLS